MQVVAAGVVAVRRPERRPVQQRRIRIRRDRCPQHVVDLALLRPVLGNGHPHHQAHAVQLGHHLVDLTSKAPLVAPIVVAEMHHHDVVDLAAPGTHHVDAFG
ncbi:MAG: hypothetical protein V9E99_00565 [Microthrixaceae bacterium]